MKTYKYVVMVGLILIVSIGIAYSQILSVTITSPGKGKECKWVRGSMHDITWIKPNIPDLDKDPAVINLLLMTDDPPQTTIGRIAQLDPNQTKYSWKVGTYGSGSLAPWGSKYYIKIQYWKGLNPLLPSAFGSSGHFSIVRPDITPPVTVIPPKTKERQK